MERWERATTGQDARAANIVLRTLEKLDRLLHLGEGDRARTSQEAIVLSADPEGYLRELQQLVEDREHPASAGR